MKKSIWISWEKHRRTQELAKVFNAELFTLLYNEKSCIRYPVLLAKTFLLIMQYRPKILYVQNPSIVLAALAAFLKPFFRYKLIVDRHSNFKLATLSSALFKWRIFHSLSRFSIRKADYTIVTNKTLFDLVNEWHGRAVVLQDKLPDLEKIEPRPLKGEFNIVCVSTFSPDEPIFEIVEAAKTVNDSVHIYITGRYQNYSRISELQKIMPKNVTTTGFLSEQDYLQLLNSVDAVMVLTTEDDLLTCGAYEAVALKKPMILSKTKAITSYFNKGAVYTDADMRSIAKSIMGVQAQYSDLAEAVKELFDELNVSWQQKYHALMDKLG